MIAGNYATIVAHAGQRVIGLGGSDGAGNWMSSICTANIVVAS